LIQAERREVIICINGKSTLPKYHFGPRNLMKNLAYLATADMERAAAGRGAEGEYEYEYEDWEGS
jgi:hypothetical protein